MGHLSIQRYTVRTFKIIVSIIGVLIVLGIIGSYFMFRNTFKGGL